VVVVDVFHNSTTAKIESDNNHAASINADNTFASGGQSVLVKATDTVATNDQAGSAGLGLGAGVGAALDIGVVQDTVDAHIGASANVKAGGDISVQAIGSDSVTSSV